MAGRPPEPDDEREPTPDAEDIDVRFADITASLGDLTVPPDRDADDASAPPGQAAQPPAEVPGGSDSGPGPRDYVLGPPIEPGPLQGEDAGYVPPEPPALASSDPLLTLAWIGIVAPVALVLIFLVAWRSMPGALLVTAGVVFVAAVAVLVWRMPGARDPDDRDDGAVV